MYPFELGLLISHAIHFQDFYTADNLKTTRAIYSFLGLNENFTKLKIGDQSLFWYDFEKVFCNQFYFQWECGDKKCMITSSLYR